MRLDGKAKPRNSSTSNAPNLIGKNHFNYREVWELNVKRTAFITNFHRVPVWIDVRVSFNVVLSNLTRSRNRDFGSTGLHDEKIYILNCPDKSKVKHRAVESLKSEFDVVESFLFLKLWMFKSCRNFERSEFSKVWKLWAFETVEF